MSVLLIAQNWNCSPDPATVLAQNHSIEVTGGGTVENPENAYDNDTGTYANLRINGNGDCGTIKLDMFENDCIRADRSAVLARVLLESVTFGASDRVAVYFSENPLQPFQLAGTVGVGDIPSGSQTWVEFDVTDIAGDEASEGFAVAVQGCNNYDGLPPEPPSRN